eukprot:GEMP01000655.1.p1 GENE.GEMP01000655.1~~GEMP01000655.1.p1  ORF type:complete len:1164 (+),score=229.63 GEMP01000655.1:211-3702(+)
MSENDDVAAARYLSSRSVSENYLSTTRLHKQCSGTMSGEDEPTGDPPALGGTTSYSGRPRAPNGTTSARSLKPPAPSGNRGTVYGASKNATAVIKDYGKTRSEAIDADSTSKQGTVMGVVFPCMANILGVLLFLRGPWIVGLAGIGEALLIVAVCCTCTFITALSLAAVSTNGKIKGGGSYFLISRSLGPSIGAGVGLCFFFANAIGAAMYVIGTVEAWTIAQPTAVFFDNDLQPTNNIRLMGFLILVCSVLFVGVGVKIVSRLATFFLMIVLLVILFMYIGCFLGFSDGLSRANNIQIPSEYFEKVFPNKDESQIMEEKKGILGPGGLDLRNNSVLAASFTGPSIKNIKANWGSDYKAAQQFAFEQHPPNFHSFTDLLAIWFPACTGIMAGSNRSAELRNPAKSIPVGTLTAQIVTTIIYLSFMFLFGACVGREYLLNDSFFAATAAWPALEVVTYGVIFSTIGAGLQSLMSASRLLAAIAEDQTLPFLNFVKQDTTGRKGLALAAVICLIAIMAGEINIVAPIITMFFLMCYFCVNATCFLLGFFGDANWRPTFRFYHWSVALFGMCLCAVLMFLISWYKALIALAFASLIMFYSSKNSHEINWGDGFRGLRHQLARNLLMRASERGQQHTKNWRPQVLVLTGMTPDNDEEGLVIHDMNLIHFASQLKHGHGLCIVGGIVDAPDLGQGSFLSCMSTSHIRNWSTVVQQSLREIGIDGFAEILYTSQRTEGIMTLIQTAGLGALVPNCVLVSWPFSWVVNADARRRFIQTIQVCTIFQKTVIMAKEGHKFALNSDVMRGTIDVWWVVSDGGILLLLPILLVRHKVWKHCKIRLYAAIDDINDDPDLIRKELHHYCNEHRIQKIEIHIVAMDGQVLFNPKSFTDLARRMRQRESLVATGVLPHKLTRKDWGDHVFTIHRNNERLWHMRYQGDLDDGVNHEVHSDYGLDANTGEKDDLQTVMRRNVISDPLPEMRPYRRLSARAPIPEFPDSPVNSSSSASPRRASMQSNAKDDGRRNVRDSGNARCFEDSSLPLGGQFNQETSAQLNRNSPAHRAMSDSGSSDLDTSPLSRGPDPPVSSFVLTEDRLESDQPCSPEILAAAKMLNSRMRQVSKKASLIVTNLPDVPEAESAFGYMQFVEHLCNELPPVMLVRGTAAEVITAYT